MPGSQMSRDDAQAALQHALQTGHRPDVVVWDIWLFSGADINTPSDASGKTLLMMAAQTGDTEMAAYALARGAAVDMRNDKNGKTALFYAAAIGQPDHVAVIDLLLTKGADIRLRDQTGKTAADQAQPGSALHKRLCQALADRLRPVIMAQMHERRTAAAARLRLRK